MEGTMERATDMMHEDLPFPGSDPFLEAAQAAESAAQEAVPEVAAEGAGSTREEISIQFAKGLCGEPFTAKDGKEYVQIKIPTEEKGIWPTFVLPANHVHENQHGKGLWARIPADGTTKIRHTEVVGEDENGKKLYDHQDEKIPNKQLKSMIEAYKEKNREVEAKPSITAQLKEPKIPVVPSSETVKPPVVGGDAR